MSMEKAVLLSLLELTQNGPVRRDAIAKHAKVPTETTEQELRKLSQNNFFDEHKGVIDASPSQRVRMAIQTLKLAADFERVCQLLSWKEFENIVAEALERNDYKVLRNFHFRQDSKRWEIDVIGHKKPLILCVDCKHWKRGWQTSAIVKAVQAQTERTKALAEGFANYSQKAGLEQWESATLIPVMMSLIPGPRKFFDDVPVVSALQFQDFINELPAQAHLLKSFHQKPRKPNEDLQKFCQ
jgi:Holliday junction resolvase-like predicted endonuclease